MKKTWTLDEVLPFIKENQGTIAEEHKDLWVEEDGKYNGVWKFITWTSPVFNGKDATYTLKSCKDCDSNQLNIWLIYFEKYTKIYYRYRVEAKDNTSYNHLLSLSKKSNRILL